ncbi:Imm10 family immunity protein [Paenibacillus sp. GCM10028914]|uniref:Imm10 family immunity protein n=1 Tax=Paenibacillus sp. GCM10028914 TaxID=3273416 RepID=UPI00360CB218
MNTLLKASFIYFGIEDETLIIGFADDEFETNDYLLLQKSLYLDDNQLLNQIHITINNQDRSKYGGIVSISQGTKLITIILTNETAESLKVSTRIDIEYDIDDEKRQTLTDYFYKLNVDNEIIFEVHR